MAGSSQGPLEHVPNDPQHTLNQLDRCKAIPLQRLWQRSSLALCPCCRGLSVLHFQVAKAVVAQRGRERRRMPPGPCGYKEAQPTHDDPPCCVCSSCYRTRPLPCTTAIHPCHNPAHRPMCKVFLVARHSLMIHEVTPKGVMGVIRGTEHIERLPWEGLLTWMQPQAEQQADSAP